MYNIIHFTFLLLSSRIDQFFWLPFCFRCLFLILFLVLYNFRVYFRVSKSGWRQLMFFLTKVAIHGTEIQPTTHPASNPKFYISKFCFNFYKKKHSVLLLLDVVSTAIHQLHRIRIRMVYFQRKFEVYN